MTRMSLSVCVAAVFFFSRAVAADDGQAGSDQADALKLARTSLPLPKQSTFEADLAQLADVLVAKIVHPAPDRFVHDMVLDHELISIFRLISDWPIETFREPLVKHFETNHEFEFESAEALLAYRDDDMTKIVESRKGVRARVESLHTFRGGETPLYLITKALIWGDKEQLSVAKPFVPLDTLLPGEKEGVFNKLNWPIGMTVHAAVSQLEDEQLSVRLQSWLWLAERGIIAPTEVVSESWPKLTEEQQELICKTKPKFIGHARLLKLFEDLMATSPESIQGHLLVRQVQLGSKSASTEARRTLSKCMERDDFLNGPIGADWSALKAVCAAPDASDVPTLIRIRQSKHESDADTALEGLAQIDHPDAIDEVGKFLAEPSTDCEYWIIVNLIRDQSIKELQDRELYLAVLAPALRKCLDSDFRPSGRRGVEWILKKLVIAFMCMSGREFMAAAHVEQKKNIRSVNFGVTWNSSKGYSTRKTYTYEDMSTATAKVCLRWYSEKLEAEDKQIGKSSDGD